MLVPKHQWSEINQVIEQRKFCAHDARFLSGDVDAWKENIRVHFKEISCDHIGEALPPIMPDFKRRIGDADKPNEEEKGEEKESE